MTPAAIPPDEPIFLADSNRPTDAHVDFAGEVLRKQPREHVVSVGQLFASRVIIDEWRRHHETVIAAFRPLLAVAESAVPCAILVAARLKRLPTIEEKVVRIPRLRLSELQDIAGMRAIVEKRKDVLDLVEALPSETLGFKRIGRRFYMDHPKESGYGGVHLIYQYQARADDRDRMHGLKIELQVRTRGQHAWATTNEVVGTFRRESLKSGAGNADWLRLFQLAGSAIAEAEGGKRGRNVPASDSAFAMELTALKSKLNVFEVLSAYSIAENAGMFGDGIEPRFYLLQFNLKTRFVNIREFELDQARQALIAYKDSENEHVGDSDFDTVLVRSDSVNEMRLAYPNYFADTLAFIRAIYSEDEIARIVAASDLEEPTANS